MDRIIGFSTNCFYEQDYECIERKGMWHPDTLADCLAEKISRDYSDFTLKNFWAILHHNVDKVWILWWSTLVKLWEGKLINPIRVLINWKFSVSFWEVDIDYKSLVVGSVNDFFESKFPWFDITKFLVIQWNLWFGMSPWHVDWLSNDQWLKKHQFKPRWLHDIKELKFLWSNDTSIWCGYFPYTRLEQLIIEIEEKLLSEKLEKKYNWMWTDIKILGTRKRNDIDVTLCVPQIANYVPDLDTYKQNLEITNAIIYDLLWKYKFGDIKISLNTKDNFDAWELYLTAIWSSIEAWDEWLVGRGNRVNGVIAPDKPTSMEGVCWKNPVYHAWKLYNIAAFEISELIFKSFWMYNEITLVSQNGRLLSDPRKIIIKTQDNLTKEMQFNLQNIINQYLDNIHKITDWLLAWKYNLC